jgi:hypothetical protein
MRDLLLFRLFNHLFVLPATLRHNLFRIRRLNPPNSLLFNPPRGRRRDLPVDLQKYPALVRLDFLLPRPLFSRPQGPHVFRQHSRPCALQLHQLCILRHSLLDTRPVDRPESRVDCLLRNRQLTLPLTPHPYRRRSLPKSLPVCLLRDQHLSRRVAHPGCLVQIPAALLLIGPRVSQPEAPCHFRRPNQLMIPPHSLHHSQLYGLLLVPLLLQA